MVLAFLDGWPAAILTAAARDAAAFVRPGQRNGAQPNRETSLDESLVTQFAELDAYNSRAQGTWG